MSFVIRLSQVLPAFTRVQNSGRYLTTALRAFDVHLHPDNSCRLTDDAVTSTRAAIKAATAPVPGSAFLEDVSSEYGAELVEELSIPTTARPIHPSRVIVNLVEKGDYDAAEAARNEFEKMEIPIEPHPEYLRMVVNALDIPEQRTRHQVFSAWLDVTPLYEHRGLMKDIADNLLRHPFDLLLLQKFCRSCVLDGITEEIIHSRILHHIFRYGHHIATTSFLEELERVARSLNKSSAEVMAFRDLAIKMHFAAGRDEIAEQLMEKNLEYREYEREQVGGSSSSPAAGSFITTLPSTTRSRYTGMDPPTVTEMAAKLRLIRKAIKAKFPRNFESYVSDFIFEYSVLFRRLGAVHALRRKVFKSASLAVRSKWAAAEQLFYSSRTYPFAILRTHMHFFIADQLLHAEAHRILYDRAEGRYTHKIKRMDSRLSHGLPPISTYQKLWPSNVSLALVWKAIIQLSKSEDLERLYGILVEHTKLVMKQDKAPQNPDHDTDTDNTSLYVTPPVNFPSPFFFHHFVVAMSTRISPLRGSKVIAEMQTLGLKPSIDDWGTLAGAYARSGDIRRLKSIMLHIDKLEADAIAADSTQGGVRKEIVRKRVMITHNSVIRGLTECGMYTEARQVQQRMQNRGYFDNGIDRRTRAVLHRLSRYERGCFDSELEKRSAVRLMGRKIYADVRRVQWRGELKDGKPTWEVGFDDEFIGSTEK